MEIVLCTRRSDIRPRGEDESMVLHRGSVVVIIRLGCGWKRWEVIRQLDGCGRPSRIDIEIGEAEPPLLPMRGCQSLVLEWSDASMPYALACPTATESVMRLRDGASRGRNLLAVSSRFRSSRRLMTNASPSERRVYAGSTSGWSVVQCLACNVS